MKVAGATYTYISCAFSGGSLALSSRCPARMRFVPFPRAFAMGFRKGWHASQKVQEEEGEENMYPGEIVDEELDEAEI